MAPWLRTTLLNDTVLFSNIGYRFYYNWWRAISWSWSAAEKWFWSILLKKMAPIWDLVPTKTSNEYRNLGRFFIFHCEFLESIAFLLDFNFILIFTLWLLWFCGLEIPSLDTMNFTFKIMKNGCMPTWHWLQNGLHHCSQEIYFNRKVYPHPPPLAHDWDIVLVPAGLRCPHH